MIGIDLGELPLAGAGYDRAALRRRDEGWLAQAWADCSVVVITSRSALPVRDGHLVRCTPEQAPSGPHRFLGLVDECAVFTVTSQLERGEQPTASDDSLHWLTLREVGAELSSVDAALATTAIALEQWHQRHTHCPRCGAPTVETEGGWIRRCTAEGSDHFPRTDPAVIMLVYDDEDRVLLGRGPQWGPGRFSTLAGFVEPGESLEAAVAREVFEEVGVRVSDVRYLASQPWPFPASLMLGFFARLAGDHAVHLDPVEMAEAGWFTRAEVQRAARWGDGLASAGWDRADIAATGPASGESRLVAISPRLSISRYLIDTWLAGGPLPGGP